MPQFRVNAQDVDEEAGRAVVRGAEARHMSRVLRLRPGQRVQVFDGAGGRWSGVVERAGAEVWVAGLSRLPGNESTLDLELLVALPKGERWEGVLEKGTELGVARFLPVYTGRTVPRLREDRRAAKVDRWSRIVAAAAKQCERGRVPAVEPPVDLAEALEALGRPRPDEVRIVWAERRGRDPWPSLRPARVVLASGPEGGWAPEDLGRLTAAGFVTMGLGPRILRADTAAVVGAALAQAQWGDLVGRAPGW